MSEGLPRAEKFIVNRRKGNEASSRKRDGTSLDVLTEKCIGGGKFGDIYEASVFVRGDLSDERLAELDEASREKRTRTFIIKKFKANNFGSVERNAQAAVAHYNAAKQAGLKVFTTYRLSEDKRSVLTTNGNNDTYICVGPNNTSVEKLGREPLLITNQYEKQIESFVSRVYREAFKAADSRLSVPLDAYLFKVPLLLEEGLDFVIGDVDRVEPVIDRVDSLHLSSNNLAAAMKALQVFFMQNFRFIDDKIKKEIMEIIDYEYNSFMTENNLWNV